VPASRFRFEPMLLLPPVGFAGVALFYLHNGHGFNDPSSGQAPALYGQAMLVLSALVLAIALLRSFRGAPAMPGDQVDLKRALAIYAILCGFIALIFALGFYVAVPVFLLLFLLLIARAKPWFCLAGAALGLGLLWGVFGQLLHMRVFAGYLL